MKVYGMITIIKEDTKNVQLTYGQHYAAIVAQRRKLYQVCKNSFSKRFLYISKPREMLPRLQVTHRASSPVQDPLPRLQEDIFTMRKFASKPVQYLMECIACLSRLGEQHSLLHRRVCEKSLLPQYNICWYGCQDSVKPRNILLRDKHADILPWYGVREG